MAIIGFIGLGTMGLPMARRLRMVGHDVRGMDLSTEACRRFEGATEPNIPGLQNADVIITMLPEGDHVSTVYDEFVLAAAKTGSILIDCSTIDVAAARLLNEKARHRSLAQLDAPVSGGPEAAGTGTLKLMVGGSSTDMARAEAVLRNLSEQIIHFGGAGSGQAAKACHNMICGITAMAMVEGFALADALGLDLAQFHDLCANAAAQSWTLENRCPIPGVVATAPSSNGFAPGFAAALMAKDLRLAQMAAIDCDQDTPFGAMAARTFSEFTMQTGGAQDFSAIYQTLRPLPETSQDD